MTELGKGVLTYFIIFQKNIDENREKDPYLTDLKNHKNDKQKQLQEAEAPRNEKLKYL